MTPKCIISKPFHIGQFDCSKLTFRSSLALKFLSRPFPRCPMLKAVILELQGARTKPPDELRAPQSTLSVSLWAPLFCSYSPPHNSVYTVLVFYERIVQQRGRKEHWSRGTYMYICILRTTASRPQHLHPPTLPWQCVGALSPELSHSPAVGTFHGTGSDSPRCCQAGE